jgi:hypothetical protein
LSGGERLLAHGARRALPDGGFGAIAIAASYAPPFTTSYRGVAVQLDPSANVVATRMLGTMAPPFPEGVPAGWVACDGSGRAHFAWEDAGGTAYAALGEHDW